MPKYIRLSNKQMNLVENNWHHAVLSYFEHIPTIEKKYPDDYYDIKYEQIEDIIEEFGINPPQDHWYSKREPIVSNIISNLFYGYIVYIIYKAIF